MITEIPLNKGSDFAVTTILRGADKQPMNLVGLDFAIDVYDESPLLQDNVIVTMVDASKGTFTLSFPWNEAFSNPATKLQFRYRVRIGTFTRTSRLLTIKVN